MGARQTMCFDRPHFPGSSLSLGVPGLLLNWLDSLESPDAVEVAARQLYRDHAARCGWSSAAGQWTEHTPDLGCKLVEWLREYCVAPDLHAAVAATAV